MEEDDLAAKGGSQIDPHASCEGKEASSARMLKDQKDLAEFWSMRRLEPEALDALDRELSDVLNLPAEAMPPGRWEGVRGWLEQAILDAATEDDLPAKRRLRSMVLSGVARAQRNVKLWRELNAMRSVVEAAARAKPPLRKVKEAYASLCLLDDVLATQDSQDDSDEDEEAADSLERALRQTTMPTSPTLARSEGRLFGAHELRRLSHDSIMLLVNSACGSVPAQHKLLYLCLCKTRELYNHGKGLISLEVKTRLKAAACNGKMSSVLTLLKIAHEGRGSLAGPRAHRRGGASEGRSRGGSIGDKSVEDELAGSMGLKSSPSSRGGRHYWGSHMDCGGWGGSLAEEQDFSDLRVPALEESFTCFLSGRILRCPVTLPCGHSFSRDALEEYVGEGDGEEKEGRLLGTTPGEGGGVGPMPVRGVGGERDDGSLGEATQGTGASPTSAGEGKARGGEGGQRGGRRCCPLPECGRAFVASGPLSVNRALDEIIARYFPVQEELASRPPTSPRTRASVAMIADGDGLEALRDVGFSEERIAAELARAGTPTPSGISGVIRRLLRDTTPVPPSEMTEAAAVSHSDLRRLNLDAISCLIDALARLEPKASVAARRGVLELLCRLEWVYRGGEGALSTGARKRLQNAVIEGYMKEVDTILRFLGAPDLPSEVDVEVVLQDQLTGIVLVDPVTLGCGHTFGKAALLEYLRRRPQADRRCLLCNWAIPADLQLRIDPLVAYILARSFDDKVKADLDSLQDALSTAPLVLTVLQSYQHNTEILAKAMGVLHTWTQGGPPSLSVLNFHDVASPLLHTLRNHKAHGPLVLRTLRLLKTLAGDEACALSMAHAGALPLLLSLHPAPSTTTSTAGEWAEEAKAEASALIVHLLTRLLLLLSPDTLSSLLGLAALEGHGGLQDKLLTLLEQTLLHFHDNNTASNPEETQGAEGHVDMLQLLQCAAKLAPPSWYSEVLYEALSPSLRRLLADRDTPEAAPQAPALWAVVIKFLERAFDAQGGIKEASLAKAMARDHSIDMLTHLLAAGTPPSDEAESVGPNPGGCPMSLVRHSGCSVDETASVVSATLGGGAGAEYGFGAYALGSKIPAGYAGSWEVTIRREQHQDQDPMWVSEEFVVLGISTSPYLSPDWTFYLKEDNPVSGINCQTGQVLVWGKGHAHYPPLGPGDTMRLGVDLRGPRHFLVLHKFTPGEPERLLFRIQLPEKIKAAYPALIIFNRLSYTGRAYSAELVLANCPRDFTFAAWMAGAEAQERKRNGGDRGGSGRGSASSPLKLREPLPRVFSLAGDIISRTCHLGPGLHRVAGRESCAPSQKGLHTYTFRRRGGCYAAIGLSDGVSDGYPLMPASAAFHLEYECSGLLSLYSRSGLVMQRRLKPFGLGQGGGSSHRVGGSGGEREEEETVRFEVTVSRRWDDDILASLQVAIFKGPAGSEALYKETLAVACPLSSVRPFVGLSTEGDGVSATYAFTSPEAETHNAWLGNCLASLKSLHTRGPESPSRRPSFRHTQLLDHLSFLAQVLSSSGCCETEVLQCLSLMHARLEDEGLAPPSGPASGPDSVPYFALFKALRAFPLLPPSVAVSLSALSQAPPSPPTLAQALNSNNSSSSDEEPVNVEDPTRKQTQRAQIADLTWTILSTLLTQGERDGQGEPRLLCPLVDAGLLGAALASFEVLEECMDACPLAASAVQSILQVLKVVGESGNRYHQHALFAGLPRLLQAAALTSLPPPSDARLPEGSMAPDSRDVEVAERLVDLYLHLLQLSLSLPAQARESLLTLRHVDRLLPWLLRRFQKDPQDGHVAAVLAGILASGDEHSHELAIFDPSLTGRPRFLPLLAEEEEVDRVEEEDEEQHVSMVLEEAMRHEASESGKIGRPRAGAWAEFRSHKWGPWRPAHWEEALWGALVEGNETWVLRILAPAQRWRHVRQRPCFVSRRGPWRSVLPDMETVGGYTLAQAMDVLSAGQPDADKARRRLRLRVMERLLKATAEAPSPMPSPNRLRSLAAPPSSGSSRSRDPPVPPAALARPPESGSIFVEKADHTMGSFDVDAEACGARFGLRPGDRVRSRRYLSSYGSVVGVADRRLWIHWDEDAGASLRDDDYQYMELEAVDRESEAPVFRSGNASGLWPLFVQGHLLESEDEVECNYQGLREGSRVTRGPTWHRNNDDGFAGNSGLVTRRSGDEVTVRWDGTDHTKTYRYSTAVGSPHDLAWVFSVEETVKAGTQLEVVRGPHWRFGNQDGGFHNSGRIVAVKGPFMVVAWNGQDEDVEEMKEAKDDATPATPGSRRPKLHGYWYGKGHREVEVLLRGCERLSLVDNRKEQRMDRRPRILEALSALLQSPHPSASVEACRVIANLAATPLPPIAYEMVHTWQVTVKLLYAALDKWEGDEAVRREASKALLALYTAGREPLHCLLLLGHGAHSEEEESKGEEKEEEGRFLRVMLDNIMDPKGHDWPRVRAVGVAGLRQVVKSLAHPGAHQAELRAHVLATLDRAIHREADGGEFDSGKLLSLLHGVLAVLAPPSEEGKGLCDVHILRMGLGLLHDLCGLWTPFKAALMDTSASLLSALSTLLDRFEPRGQAGVLGPILGPAVVLLVVQLGLPPTHSSLRRLLEHVDSAPVFSQLAPFSLLRCGGVEATWPMAQLRHLLRASASLLDAAAAQGEDALIELVVLEDALDLYSQLIDAALSQVKGLTLTQWAPALAAALDCVRLLACKAPCLHDEVIRRGMPQKLRALLQLLQTEAGVVGPQLPSAFFPLLEVLSARESGEGLSDGSEEAFALRPDLVEVSSGTRERAHLVDGHPGTCWMSQDRMPFPGVVLDRRVGNATPRALRRPESSGHSIVLRLPYAVPTGSSQASSSYLSAAQLTSLSTPTPPSLARARTSSLSSSLSGSGTVRLRRPSRTTSPLMPLSPSQDVHTGSSLDDLLALPPSLSHASLLSDDGSEREDRQAGGGPQGEGSGHGGWSKLQMRRGMYGNYTPSEFWVLVPVGTDRYTVVKRCSFKDSRAGSWETILEREELEALTDVGACVESIRIEIYRNVNMGNNSKVNGLRFVAAAPEEGPMVEPEPILHFLREYRGSGHGWLAPALSVLNRVSNDSAFDALRLRRDNEPRDTTGSSGSSGSASASGSSGATILPSPPSSRGPASFSGPLHVGMFVRCRWSKSNGMHPAVITAVHRRGVDVHYHDGDRDFGRPRHAIEPLDDMRDLSRAQGFFDEVVRRVRQSRAFGFFHPTGGAEDAGPTSGDRPGPTRTLARPRGLRELHLGDRRSSRDEPPSPATLSRESSSSVGGDLRAMRASLASPLSSTSTSPFPPSAPFGSSRPLGGASPFGTAIPTNGPTASLLREASRLRDCLQETQRTLLQGAAADEATRAQMEEQIRGYERMMMEQERRLLELVRAEGDRDDDQGRNSRSAVSAAFASALLDSPVLSTEGSSRGQEEEDDDDEDGDCI